LTIACDAKEPIHVTTVQSSCTVDTVGGYKPELHYQFFTDMEPEGGPWTCPEDSWRSEPGRPAICRLTTQGTDTSKFAAPSMEQFTLSGGPIDMRVAYTLDEYADETDDFLLRIGFCNTTAGNACTNGAWIEHTSADHYWHCRSVNNSTGTSDTSDEEIIVGDWATVWLHIDTEIPAFTAGYTGEDMFCSITTNIPDSNPTQPMISMEYITGSESHYLDIDYVVIDQDFSTSR
jgi:hypothetical protein